MIGFGAGKTTFICLMIWTFLWLISCKFFVVLVLNSVAEVRYTDSFEFVCKFFSSGIHSWPLLCDCLFFSLFSQYNCVCVEYFF